MKNPFQKFKILVFIDHLSCLFNYKNVIKHLKDDFEFKTGQIKEIEHRKTEEKNR